MRDRLDGLVVAEHDERAGAAAQDPLEAVAQLGARGDGGQCRAQSRVGDLTVARCHGSPLARLPDLRVQCRRRSDRSASVARGHCSVVRDGVAASAPTSRSGSTAPTRGRASRRRSSPSIAGSWPRRRCSGQRARRRVVKPSRAASASRWPGSGPGGARRRARPRRWRRCRAGAATLSARADQRDGDREVGRRAREGRAADGRGVDVATGTAGCRPGARRTASSIDSRDESRPLTARRGLPIGDRRHQRLHLADQRPAALERHRQAGAGRRRRYDGRRTGRVGSVTSTMPSSAEVEAADLVDRAEAVLDRAQHAQPGVALALELQHDVDDVLERARPGDRAVLGDVADEQGRQVALLGDPHQRAGDRADLGDAAGDAVDLGAGDRLHRVDDQQVGLDRLDVAEHGGQVDLGGEVEAVLERAGALGAQPHLRRGLLAGDVERARCRRGPPWRRPRAAASTCRRRARRRAAARRPGRSRRRAPGRARPTPLGARLPRPRRGPARSAAPGW